MVLLYSSSPRIEARLSNLIGDLARPAGSWKVFATEAPKASCAIIALDGPRSAADVDQVERLTRDARFTRFLLVIEDGQVDDDLLGRVAVARVIRLSRVGLGLREAVVELTKDSDLGWIVAAFAGAPHIQLRIRSAAKKICTNPPPVPTITSLAPLVHCCRETLSRDWRASCGARTSLNFEEFMQWIVLLWACLLRPQHRTWFELAFRMEVALPTLRSYAIDLTGHSLKQIDELGPDYVRRRFTEDVLNLLVHSQSDHN